MRHGNCTSHLRLLGVAMCALVLSLASPADAAWRVWLEQTEITAAAAPLDHGNMPEVNVMLLAPYLGVTADVRGGELTLTDIRGGTWRTRNGGAWLESDHASLPMSSPALVQGATAYLPLAAAAEVAGLQCEIDPVAHRAILSRATPEAAEGDSPASSAGTEVADDGWQTFSIEKTAEEKASLRQAEPVGSQRAPGELLPPSQDQFHLGLGLGYAQQLDWGLEVSGRGGFGGKQVNLNSVLTLGRDGLRLDGGHISVQDAEFGWSAEAGDLSSNLWGIARGVRYSRAAENGRWRSLSLYLRTDDPARRLPHTVVSYSDRLQLGTGLQLGGEVASDGAYVAQMGLTFKHFSLAGYDRRTPEMGRGGRGTFFALDLGRFGNIYGGVNISGAGGERSYCRTLAIRAPLVRGADLTLEYTAVSDLDRDSSYQSAMFTFPVGPARLMTRYQMGYSGGSDSGLQVGCEGRRDRGITNSLAYFANPRINFDYQVNLRWQEGGDPSQYEQLVTTYQLSPRTQLQALTRFPALTDVQRLRLRLSHELTRDWSLLLDYGQLASFQPENLTADRRGFRVMLRKEVAYRTPTRGGEVFGRVLDEAGRPVAGVVVEANPYRAVSGPDGRYQLRRIPSGKYHVALDESTVPANYRPGNGVRDLVITSRSREQVDLTVIPLNAVTGHVYEDRNRNGRCDSGEGVAGAVLHLNGFATATTDSGGYGFYNLEPGHYTVRLDVPRLPEGYGALGTVEMAVDLPADRPVTGVDLKLEKLIKPIVFQGLP